MSNLDYYPEGMSLQDLNFVEGIYSTSTEPECIEYVEDLVVDNVIEEDKNTICDVSGSLYGEFGSYAGYFSCDVVKSPKTTYLRNIVIRIDNEFEHLNTSTHKDIVAVIKKEVLEFIKD